jgi:nucleotide-binding universal stress UspA family protein
MSTVTAERWIVGHDGSSGADIAARWALTQCGDRHRDVDLVRAWQIPPLEFPIVVDDVREFAPGAVCSDFDELVALGAAVGATVTGTVVEGGSAPVLLDASRDASLLVVGSRGLGGFRRLLLGSTSSQCATHAEVPTVVVPASATVDRPVRRITVGVDGSPRSLRALEWARTFGSSHAGVDTNIKVVGAWRESKSGYTAVAQHYTNELDETRDRFNELLDEREADAGSGQIFERRFAYADPSQTLLAEGNDSDLLVVGARGHSGLSAGILGSVSTYLVHHTEVPVVVVPSDG